MFLSIQAPFLLRLSQYLLFTVVPLIIINNAHADTTLEEIVVTTGTKTERKLLDVPVRTEVVSKEELEKTHARDLAEALKNVPGLLLKSIHGKSGQEVWLQGLDADRVLVLIDGRPVSASTGASVDLSQISMGDVDHIEIVKGAVSALYGSEAMGGVVNIISKPTNKPFNYSLILDGGTYGSQDVGGSINDKHIKADFAAKKGQWDSRLTVDVRDKSGTDLDKSTWSFEGDAGQKSNVSTELGYTSVSGSVFKIKPTYYKEDISKNFSGYSPGIGEIKKKKKEVATRKNVTLSFDKKLESGAKVSAWFMHEKFKDASIQDIVSTLVVDQERNAKLSFDKAEVQWDQPVGGDHLFTVGLVGHKSSLAQTQTVKSGSTIDFIDEIGGQKNRSNTEFYLQDDYFFSDTLEFLPGFRYQNDSDFGSNSAPKINLMYMPMWSDNFDTKLRFGVGKGYRVPTLKDRHYTFDHSAVGYMVLGNPDLTPETSTSFSMGVEIAKSNNYRVEINVFHNKITNLIGTDLDKEKSAETGLSIYQYTNIDEAETQGVDFNSIYTFTPKLSGGLSYNYLEATDENTNKKLTRRPAHQVKMKLNYEFPQYTTNVSVYGNYQSKEYINSENTITSPGYSTFDLKLNKRIRKGTKVFLGIDNLTDTHRNVPITGHDLRPESGRFIYAGIRFDG